MKKTLRFSLLGMLLMLCGTTMAQTEVTIDFDNDYQTLFPTLPGVSSSANSSTGAEASSDGDFTATTTSTAVSGVTVTVAPAEDAKTPSRIWSAAPRLRMYSGSFTVTSATENITKIEFTGHSTNFNLSTTTGTLSGKTWVGEAKEIEFAVAKNTQINKIVVTLGGDPGTVEPEPQPVEGLSTCAEVIAGTDGTIYRVKGTCTEIKNTTYGNWNLTDETGQIYIYGTLDAEGKTKNFTSLGIEVGDIVTVEGPRKDYKGTIELVDVTVISIEKGTVTPVETEVITVAKALELIDALTDGATTTETYQVKGFVVGAPDFQRNNSGVLYGNVNLEMADEKGGQPTLTVYHAKSFNGENFTEETILNTISEGDEVVFEGKLQKYVKNGVTTPELATGSKLISVNGVSTGIAAVERTAASTTVYNLQGQRVSTMQRGLYIVGGKKYLMK
ncbi:MAG: hypothetical protein IJV24_01695 [Prevotella sp.]|nr:hypothetical protein [Prevotella sp.]